MSRTRAPRPLCATRWWHRPNGWASTGWFFGGYSDNADLLLLYLKARLGPELKCYAISHVITAQFDNTFEMAMLAKLFQRRRLGQLDGLASVTPNAGKVFPEFWPGLILNYAPNLPAGSFPAAEGPRSAYLPLATGWRKNMFTNILAASLDLVKVAHYPGELDRLVPLDRLRLVHFLHGTDLLAEMAARTVVMLATLAECQPMTQLEALTVGTRH